MKAAPSPDIEIPLDAAKAFQKFIVAEYSYFTPSGSPLCWPVTPYWYPERGVLAVATGLAYPNKANYAANNSKVAMLFSDAHGSGIDDAPEVYVAGEATVLDENLQANTDRYVRELRKKFLSARFALNPISVKFLDFYLPRLWIEITPMSITVRKRAAVRKKNSKRQAGEILRSPLADRERAQLHWIASDYGEGVLSVEGSGGYPAMERVSFSSMTDGTLVLEGPTLRNLPKRESWRAAICIHRHSLGGTRFRAYMVRGKVFQEGDAQRFVAERLVGSFVNGFVFPLSVIPHVARLRLQLNHELERRGWTMPHLRVP